MVPQTIRWRLHLPVCLQAVYSTLDSDEGRRAFWAERAPEVDGCVEFQFINGETYRGRILERRPPFLWVIEYFGGRVAFTLSSDDENSTDLLLTHEGVSEHDWIDTYAGWLNVLLPLKAWVVHGIDLRNHDPKRTWQNGFADQ